MKTNSLIKIAGVLFFGLFASCEEKTDETEVTCELSYETIFKQSDESSTQTIAFEADANVSEGDAKLFWSIDGVEQNENGDLFEYTFTENGVYEVCVLTETPECPSGFMHNGVSWGAGYCKEITIDNLNETTDGCPNISFTKKIISNDGFMYKFSASGAPESRYSWFINEEYIQVGLEGDDDQYLTHTFSENGTYTICVFVETPDCPKGTEYCVELVLDNKENPDCPELSATKNLISNDGLTYKFSASGAPESRYSWYIGEEYTQVGLEGDDDQYLTHTFSKNGTYTICVFVETPECPYGTESCVEVIIDSIENETRPVFNITVDNPHFTGDCLDLTYDYSVADNNNNKYILEASELDNLSEGGKLSDNYYGWSIRKSNENSDEYIGTGRVLNHEFTEVGNYVICVFVETPECPLGVKFCKNFKVEYITVN